MPDPKLLVQMIEEYFAGVTPEQYFKDVRRDEEKPELYDSRKITGGRVCLRIRVVEREGLRLAALTSAQAHIAETRDDVALPPYLVCDTVKVLQADGTAAALPFLTDVLRTDVYLWLASFEGVPANISAPRTMTHEDHHYPLHPVNEHEKLFRVMGLSLETLESWNGDAISLETDKLEEIMPPPQQETVENGAFTDSLDSQRTISTIESERLSPTARGGQERVREGIIPNSEGALVHGGVIEVPSGRGEHAMKHSKPLTIDSIDFDNDDELDAFTTQVLEEGWKTLQANLQEAIRLGIIDEKGNLLKTELPPDMREDAETDFGG